MTQTDFRKFCEGSTELFDNAPQRVEIPCRECARFFQRAALDHLNDFVGSFSEASGGEQLGDVRAGHPPQDVLYGWVRLVSGTIQREECTLISGGMANDKPLPRLLAVADTLDCAPAVNDCFFDRLVWHSRFRLLRLAAAHRVATTQ